MTTIAYHDTSNLVALPAALYDIDKAAFGLSANWNAQATLYQRVWPYFTGEIFDTNTQPTASGEEVPKWPLRINQIRRACVTHAMHLWGLTSNSAHVRFTVQPKGAASESRRSGAKERALALGAALTDFFNDGPHPNLLREAGRIFNVFGGVFVRLQQDPTARFGARLSLISPEAIFPVYHPVDYDNLLRVHIVAQITSAVAAAAFGYTGKAETGSVEYIETWTPQHWQVTLGQVGSKERQVAVDPATGEPMSGPNNFRDPVTGATVIPIIYVPRLRTANYWGLSLADELRGLQDEFNTRMADYGDAVSYVSQLHIYGHDLSRRRGNGPMYMPAGLEIFDLGDTGPSGHVPELKTIEGPNISTSTAAFAEKVEAVLYDLAGISPVMRGIDEGSQRSGATLEARAIPTISMIEEYRVTWALAFGLLARLALMLAYNYNGGRFGDTKITKAEFGHGMSVDFAPILPRDIAEINNTIQIQRPAGTMSVERAIDLSPDVKDRELELQRIQEEQARKLAEQQKMFELKAAQSQADGSKQDDGKEAGEKPDQDQGKS